MKRVSYPCSYDTSLWRGVSGEPLFEKCGCLCAFDAAPERHPSRGIAPFLRRHKNRANTQIDFAVLTGDVKAGPREA